MLRALGAGSRFESITRGVSSTCATSTTTCSVLAVFLALNVYAVDSQGWAGDGGRRRHMERRIVLALVAANFLVANFWLSGVGFLRWDATQGNQYSISEATKSYLRQLREPLLIRGYFSAKTHPLLGPLGPELKNLLTEYGVAGGDMVRVEIVDPTENPELEDEANSKYGIRAVPFQVASRYEASLVSSYFDVLVQYGDEYEVLSFSDLIDVKVRGEPDLDVRLKNPEYGITRSIKKVLYGFQGGGSVFDNVTKPVAFTGYISADDRLPEELRALRGDLDVVLLEMQEESGGKLTAQIVDPDAGGGEVALQIAADYGFRPMAASLFDLNTFYFYLTLTDGETLVQMPIPVSLDREGLRRAIEEGLKRYAVGLLKTVGLSAPQGMPPYMQQQMPHMQPPPGNEFTDLRNILDADFSVQSVDLPSGQVEASADVLMVVDPSGLDDKAVFAIDQFLMRGGTVMVAAGAYRTMMTPQSLTATPAFSGLDDWLAHQGVTIDPSLVMDPKNAAFPVPVTRQAGGFTFRDIRMTDYPYFVDVRGDSLNQDVAFTAAIDWVTMAWSSPVEVDGERNAERTVTTLMTSSAASWRSTSTDITPSLDLSGEVVYTPEGEQQANTLAVMLEGRFESFFDESPLAEEEPSALDEGEPELLTEAEEGSDGEDAGDEEDADTLGTVTSVIDRSPESARLIVIGSASFLADQTVRMVGSADGMVYGNSHQLMANLVDWAVEDRSLLGIRARGHFNRTLEPMETDQQRVWEYVNYALALAGLALVFGLSRQRRLTRRNAFQTQLEVSS